MKVFFATNRNLESSENGSTSRNPRFGIHPDEFRIGTAEVRITKAEEIEGERLNDEVACSSVCLAEEEYDRTEGKYTKRGSDKIFPQLLQEISNNTDSKNGIRCSVMVFIHGYDNSFKESINTGAKLALLYSSDDHRLIPFVFSWPSDGKFGNIPYLDDRRDAELSGYAGARLLACFFTHLRKLRRQDSPCSSSAFLITHSMGAYMLRFAVQNLQKMPCQVSQIFDAIILTAPDVDVDALEAKDKLLPVNKLAREVVVYVNKNDKVLSAAQNILDETPMETVESNIYELKAAEIMRDETPRMGLNGPRTNAFTKLGVPLTTVRCHNVDFDHMDRDEFGSGHWYYRRSIAVIKDVQSVLSGKDPEQIAHRKEVCPTKPDIYRYRLAPPEKYLNRPGTEPPPEEDEG